MVVYTVRALQELLEAEKEERRKQREAARKAKQDALKKAQEEAAAAEEANGALPEPTATVLAQPVEDTADKSDPLACSHLSNTDHKSKGLQRCLR